MIPARERIKAAGSEPDKEDDLSSAVSKHLQRWHPSVRFHIDMAGMHHTTAQAAQHKGRNPHRGWPDLQIPVWSGEWAGLHIELKVSGTNLFISRDGTKRRVIGWESAKGAKYYQDPNDKQVKPCKRKGRKIMRPVFDSKVRLKGDWADAHLEEQAEWLAFLRGQGRLAVFGIGLQRTLLLIEGYLENDLGMIEEGLSGTGQQIESLSNIKFFD
jgi:hypothetical protein